MLGATNVFAGFCCKKYKTCDYATLILQQNKKNVLEVRVPSLASVFCVFC